MKRKKFLSISAVLILIFILVASLFPSSGERQIWHLDKLGHFFTYFIFSINLSALFQRKKERLIFLFLAIILGFLLEIVQFYIPGRTQSIYDAMINTIGIGLGAYLFERKSGKINWLLRIYLHLK